MLRRITFFVLVSAIAPYSAYADAIRVTSGTFSESTSTTADFSFAGTSFELSGSASSTTGLPLQQCTICEPDAAFSPAGAWVFEGQLEEGGILTTVTGELNFHSGNLRIPSLAENQSLELTRAFAFVGTVTVEGSKTLHLVGHGLATIQFFRQEGEGVLPTLVRYDFSASDATATPEPATIALVSSGLLGAVAARRRRKKIQ